jgi:ribosomal-protein-alanine N-acetyltransferase
VRPEDAKDVFEYASDPEVPKYSVWQPHQSIGDSQKFLDSVIEQYKSHQVTAWGVEHKQDRKLIGTCGFNSWIIEDNRAEIGYALSRQYWGCGYMPEAVREVVAFGFHKMGLNRIEARCQVENTASARVMEKVGMEFEGILREQAFTKGSYKDMKIYSLLKREWVL